MDRAEFSRERIAELGERLAGLEEMLRNEPLCIYATGSYGRLEAWAGSDIDVFFLHKSHPETPFSRLNLIKVSARLIEATEEMGFPPFSGDGRYLDVHYLELMREVLGSREDDSLNAFTARMLLLLESRPVFGAERYRHFLETVVSFYFRDFHDHAEGFLPTFLNNDILRFWRTLTLNYEHDRFEIETLSPPQRPTAKAKSALKNYKLKVSRLATCFDGGALGQRKPSGDAGAGTRAMRTDTERTLRNAFRPGRRGRGLCKATPRNIQLVPQHGATAGGGSAEGIRRWENTKATPG